MKKAKLTNSDDGQVVILPDEFRFTCSEVYVRRDRLTGDVVLSAKPASWREFFGAADKVKVSADFMLRREQPIETRDPSQAWDGDMQ